jgi:hypothetical protein
MLHEAIGNLQDISGEFSQLAAQSAIVIHLQ